MDGKLTFFTIPKSFRGHFGVIQTNAIRSWLAICPGCEVILLGDDEGTAEVASELGIRHAPEVEKNEFGTPLVNSIFSLAQDIARYPLMCYVNADIILMSDFLSAIGQIKIPSFLVVGQRWDLDVNETLDFNDSDWEEKLQVRLGKEGKLHGKSGLDYFVFPRGMYRDIPPFAIGRSGWDNWLIYGARALRVPVIDATKVITIIHQNHDYSHVPGGTAGVWQGPERERNRQLAGYGDYAFILYHANLILTPQGMRRAWSLKHLYFRISSVPNLVPGLRFLNPFFKGLTKLLRIISNIVTRPATD